MNFSVKRVLKRRHNYLIPFLFIFCARCIYKSSYTPPSHPPKHIPLQGEPHRFANNLRKSDRIGQKICVTLLSPAAQAAKKSVFICELKIGGRRESQICGTSIILRFVKNRKYLGYFRYFPYICSM